MRRVPLVGLLLVCRLPSASASDPALPAAPDVPAPSPELSDATKLPQREVARQLFAAAVSLARAGRYEAAKGLFLEAYAAAPHYLVLYNIAQAELRLGQDALAARDLRRFLEEGGAAIAPERREEVEQEIARIESDRLGRPARVALCLSGRGDKDLATLLTHFGNAP